MSTKKWYYHILKQLLIVSLAVLTVESARCDRLLSDLVVSDQTTANNGKYVMEIEGKPERYVPNELYEVTIKVDFYVYPSSKFKRFLLSLESKANPDDSDDVTHQTGKFELGSDALSKFSYICPNTVIEANTQPKKQIILTWIAPPPNSGCVALKATVIESRERWYTDDVSASDGFLTKTLCEDFGENEDALPDILDFCCACDEAKYEMAFQGNWIRNNHPKGFPEDLFTTKFSDIVGASHKNGNEFWNVDTEPSPGLKELAFNGSTRTLESELMDNIANIHTIIKARGLAYPNITSSSYAVFRVDNENHLVSMVTKIMPSPDWIVGVPSMELCLSNCSWKQFRTINLYPMDVGIDFALEYTGNEPSGNPHPVVTEITSSEPADPRSPFFAEDGAKMKPIARLHFQLEKIYKKECDPDRKPPDAELPQNEQKQETFHPLRAPSHSPPNVRSPPRDSRCETTGWGRWSSCSVQCGKGHMTRNVKFRHNPTPGMCEDITREETLECDAECESGEQEMHVCANIIWSQWTPCTVTCGRGIKTRYRIPSQLEDEDEADKQCVNKEVVECEEDC